MQSTLFQYDEYVYLPALKLWLDSTRRQDFAFVSHAHTDHAGKHRRVMLSEGTLPFYRHRIDGGRGTASSIATKPVRRSRPTTSIESLPLMFHTPLLVDDHEVILAPAGHVLGSAQLTVRFPNDVRLTYTGDLKLHSRPTSEAATVPACDVLIIESTFGKPRYHFPPIEEVQAAMLETADAALHRGQIPVFFAYALGKAQEAVRLMTDAGRRVLAHPTVAAINRLYEQAGVTLGAWEELRQADLADSIIIAPPSWSRGARPAWLPPDVKPFTTMLTGWALDGNVPFRYGTDAAIPLSDHADWAELLRYVELAAPSRVYTLHGFPDLAAHLRGQGIFASHLPDHQPTLFDWC